MSATDERAQLLRALAANPFALERVCYAFRHDPAHVAKIRAEIAACTTPPLPRAENLVPENVFARLSGIPRKTLRQARAKRIDLPGVQVSFKPTPEHGTLPLYDVAAWHQYQAVRAADGTEAA